MKKSLVAAIVVLIWTSGFAQPTACPVPLITYNAVCGDDSTQLIASSGFDTYAWFPGAGLSDSTIQNPMALMTASTIYSLITTVLGPELVFNNDFALGNTGFISGQTYSPWYSPCNYYVGDYFFTTSYYFPDHTSTTDNFYMSVDGCSPATILWEQTVSTLDPATVYDFSFWASRADQVQPIFEVHLIGNVTGDVIVATQPGIPYTGIWTWDEYGTTAWNSGANTSVTIRVINLETNGYGDDFGIDDFSLRKVCIDTTSVTLLAGDLIADFDFVVGCPGTASGFTDMTPGATNSWSWNFGDGTTSNIQNPQHIYSNSGTYSVTLFTTLSGCQDSVTLPILIPENPSANFSFVNDCYYNVAAFTDLSIVPSGSIMQWEWNFGDGSVGVLQNDSHQYMNGGTYSVELIVTSDNNCKDSMSQLINRFEAPVANFTSITEACELACIPFTDLSTFSNIPIASWQWNFGNGQLLTTQNPVPCFTNLSTTISYFDVTLTVVNDSGCQHTFSVADYIEIFPAPIASFSYNPGVPDATHSTVEFNNSSLFADSYSWNFGDSDVSTDIDPSHEYEGVPGSYLVTLIATSFNGSCDDTAQTIIVIQYDPLFYVPNCFTPDGDAFNQVFQPVFTEGYDLYDYHLTIFDRWGEIVFESYNATFGWNGTYGDSGLVQDGVYIWDMRLKELNSEMQSRHTGHVTVLK